MGTVDQGTWTQTGVKPNLTEHTSPGPLVGRTVLEVGARIGASVCGSLLAQLGATVIFVEVTGPCGFSQPKWDWRDQFSAGKQSLCVHHGQVTERALLAKLASSSDVVLMSGDIDSLCYGDAWRLPQEYSAVVCDVTAFGNSGPLRGSPATDAQVQALVGMMDATGVSDGPPMAIPLPLIEQLAGVYAAAGVIAALHQQGTQPFAIPVEVALYDVAFSAMTSFLAPALCYPDREEASRLGNRHTMAAPWNVYRANDGWVLICAGNDVQWERLCDLIGERERGLSPRLIRNVERVKLSDEVDALVQGWVHRRSIAECVQSLSALGIPCGPVAPLDGYPREVNLEHRHMVNRSTGTGGHSILLPSSPLRMSRTPGATLLNVPAPDADRAVIVQRLFNQAKPNTARWQQGPVPLPRPLTGVRVIEVGHYTTAPVATRLLAALGAEVIKVEPLEGEAVRAWPPARNDQGIFFTFQNADKKSLSIDMSSADGGATLRKLLASADVLVENLRPGALARKGFGPKELLDSNPRLIYCSISGFGVDSLYEGRPAFDTVIQAMSGLMSINCVGDMPLKTGPSLADVMGAAVGLVSVLGALEERKHSGKGQEIDLSMQDICAWATQTGWNGLSTKSVGDVVARGDRFVFEVDTMPDVPILTTREMVREPQTVARALWFEVPYNGTEYPVLASPVRVGTDPASTPHPGPTLGRDNELILRGLQ